MATITVGTVSTGTLTGILVGSPSTAAADFATINQSVYDDQYFLTPPAPTTALTATVSGGSATLASVSGFTNVVIGQFIVGPGIPAGTIVLNLSTTASTITMSNPASASLGASQPFVTVPFGHMPNGVFAQGAQSVTVTIPNRGVLKALPSDIIAVDPQTGWPILLSKAAAAATAAWTHT